MHNDRVYEASIHKSSIALPDDTARCHVGRITADVPPTGARLIGLPPQLGMRILLRARSGRAFRVLFEMINSDRQATIERLHPRLTR
jgi:hypothetical protein